MSPSTRPTPKSPTQSPCQESSPFQSETILSTSFIAASPRTEDKVTPSSSRLELNTPLSHGVQVELSQESLEFLEVVPQELVKLLSVTCAERLECLLHLKSGETGIKNATSPREDMPLPQLLLLPLVLHSSWLEVTKSTPSQNSHLSSMLRVQTPKPSSLPSRNSELVKILPRSESPSKLDKELVNTETLDTS